MSRLQWLIPRSHAVAQGAAAARACFTSSWMFPVATMT